MKLTSDDVDDETLTDVQYALFRDLNYIEGVNAAHFSARPAAGERGALAGIGVVLKAVAPGAITGVVDAFATRLSNAPEIDLEVNGVKLSTRNLGVSEFKTLLAEALGKKD